MLREIAFDGVLPPIQYRHEFLEILNESLSNLKNIRVSIDKDLKLVYDQARMTHRIPNLSGKCWHYLEMIKRIFDRKRWVCDITVSRIWNSLIID